MIAGDVPADIVAGIEDCALEAHKQMPDTRIILLGVLPSGKEQGDIKRLACDEIHRLLCKVSLEGVEYINPTSWFINEDGSLKTGLYGGDFIHLTPEGYKVWSMQIARILAEQK